MDSPDLDPLLDALDRFPEVRDDPSLADTVFPALDRPRRSPIGWFEVARLRRLLPVPGQPCGACPIDRDALDKVAVGFFRDLETNGLLGEISASVLLRPGAFVARLAALPVPEKKAPPLLHFVRDSRVARHESRSARNSRHGSARSPSGSTSPPRPRPPPHGRSGRRTHPARRVPPTVPITSRTTSPSTPGASGGGARSRVSATTES